MEQIIAKIDGMMCGMCESHMNDMVRNNFKVKKVTSSHAKKETVIVAEEGFDLSLIHISEPTRPY